jgi:hypothetical protein
MSKKNKQIFVLTKSNEYRIFIRILDPNKAEIGNLSLPTKI